MIEVTSNTYTVWVDYGYEGWHPYDFNTIEEVLEFVKECNDYVLTKRIELTYK